MNSSNPIQNRRCPQILFIPTSENMDYPFNLKGILYFPKINTEYDSLEGKIKLYNNQVFIADNIKEVIPEFLMLLKGVIDCPDLPLNVSRSALQNDGFVKKISDYISKKVADKLTGLCKTDREEYEKYWDDIGPFVKFGVLKDEKFAKKVEPAILFKSIYDNYLTLEDLKKSEHKPLEEHKSDENADKENVVEENATSENKAEENAKKAIKDAGFEVGNVAKQFDAEIAKGIVIGQEFEPGKELEKGKTIGFTISDGPPLETTLESTEPTSTVDNSTISNNPPTAPTAATTEAIKYRYTGSINTTYELSDLIGPGASQVSLKVMVRLKQIVNGQTQYTTLMEPRTITGDTILPLRFNLINGAYGVEQGQVEVVKINESGGYEVIKSFDVEFFKGQ